MHRRRAASPYALTAALLLAAAALAVWVLACSGDSPREADDAGAVFEAGPTPPISLLELSVTASPYSGANPSTLTPAFSPGSYDYYVQCAAGHNRLSVSWKAPPGDTGRLSAPISTQASPTGSATVDVVENGALVMEASDGTGAAQYWVRCLPHDFPGLVWTEHASEGPRTPGYYLMGVARDPSAGSAYAIVFDTHGVPVWYAVVPPDLPSHPNAMFDVESLAPGTISFFPTPGVAFSVERLSPLTNTTVTAAPDIDEHELRVLPDGDYLGFSNPSTLTDLTGVTVTLTDGGTEVLNGQHRLVTCHIYELTPDGRKVWTWDAQDHFDLTKDPTWPEPIGGGDYDLFHCNSIDVDPKTGNLLVSARQMNSLFYIEKATGKILWKMGGSRYTKEGAPYVEVSDPFFCQHDARLLPGWKEGCSGARGQVSLFDDETNRSRPARAVVYDVSVPSARASGCDGGGGSHSGNGTATVAWEYEGPANSQAMGSFRITEDGSRVIGWGEGAGPPKGLTEVDRAGHDLLDFVFADGLVSYRALKVPLTQFDLTVLHRTAGLPD